MFLTVSLHLPVDFSLRRPPSVELTVLREGVYIESTADTVRNEVSFVSCRGHQLSCFIEPTPYSTSIPWFV
jgi:hypothetical protein